MALYSWFSKNNVNNKSTRPCNTLLKASGAAKSLESNTMWPTAKIKSGVTIRSPLNTSTESNSVNNPNKSQSIDTTINLSNKTAHIITK